MLISSIEPLDVMIHMSLEAVGGAVLVYAYRFCGHWRHRLVVWLVLAFIFSVLTVYLVG